MASKIVDKSTGGNPRVDSSHKEPVILKTFMSCHRHDHNYDICNRVHYYFYKDYVPENIFPRESLIFFVASVINYRGVTRRVLNWPLADHLMSFITWRTCSSRVAVGACGWTLWTWRFNIRRAAGFQGFPSAILKLVVWSAETYLNSLSKEMSLDQIISVR